MKTILLIVGVLFLSTTFSQNQNLPRYNDESETIMKNNILFSIENNQPITGTVYKKYQNGSLKIECYYKNGLKNGVFRTWYENGNKHIEVSYINNVINGYSRKWYENGNIEMETYNKNGLPNGNNKAWFENGQLKIEYIMENGKPRGLIKTWYESGYKKSEKMVIDDKELYKKCWDESGNIKTCN